MTEASIATEYVVNDAEQTINGKPIPWYISTKGPLVEALDDAGSHILWLPIIVDAPMPTPPEGRPDGEPIESELAVACGDGLLQRNRRATKHEIETPARGHDPDGACCRRAEAGEDQ